MASLTIVVDAKTADVTDSNIVNLQCPFRGFQVMGYHGEGAYCCNIHTYEPDCDGGEVPEDCPLLKGPVVIKAKAWATCTGCGIDILEPTRDSEDGKGRAADCPNGCGEVTTWE